MKKYLKRPREKLKEIREIEKDTWIYSVIPRALMKSLRKYFRLKVEGTDLLPKRGRALIIPNHSGFLGLDAVLLGHEVLSHTDRVPRLLAHHLWFISTFISNQLQKFGIQEATTNNGLDQLRKNRIVILFPEGERGNFKPTLQRYRLKEFRRGFVRMALMTQSPIIPTIIIGAEESNITLAQLKWIRPFLGTVLPIPLNLFPLPARWKIKFLEPIHLPLGPEAADDSELVHEIAMDIQSKIQSAINKELSKREKIFF